MRDTKNTSGIPLYFQLKQILQEKILTGEYRSGERIPPETDLCRDYEVSRITVRKAIDTLVKEKLLYTKQGIGTFVTHHKLLQKLTNLYSFTEHMLELGLTPTSTVIAFTVEPASLDEMNQMNLPDSDRLVNRIERVRRADSEPILLERTLVPHYMCPNLTKYNLADDSLYRILSEEYHLNPSEAEETYEAALIRPREAELLECSRGEAVFNIHRIGYLTDGRVYELTDSTGRGDHLRFSVHLVTNQAEFSRHVGIKK